MPFHPFRIVEFDWLIRIFNPGIEMQFSGQNAQKSEFGETRSRKTE